MDLVLQDLLVEYGYLIKVIIAGVFFGTSPSPCCGLGRTRRSILGFDGWENLFPCPLKNPESLKQSDESGMHIFLRYKLPLVADKN
ncbi:MAG: hypothetical protein HY619_03445 [Thaumarchaeota archaeon]|nr:hypothetical protein [Nitrososphaerota archaeon]